MIKITVKPGEEVIEKITKIIQKENIKEGAIVSVIGAVDECQISVMSKDDPKKDTLMDFKQPFEISGNGEISEGKVHIHAVLGGENGETISGHLHFAKVKDWFVKAYVIPL